MVGVHDICPDQEVSTCRLIEMKPIHLVHTLIRRLSSGWLGVCGAAIYRACSFFGALGA